MVIGKTLASAIIVTCASRSVLAGEPPSWLLLSSDASDKTIANAVGKYRLDGTAYSYPRYKLDSDDATRYLYRSPTGSWTITGSEANIEKSKGTIVSTAAAEEPIGNKFRFFSSEKKWVVDDSFVVVDVSEEEAASLSSNTVEVPVEADASVGTDVDSFVASSDAESKEEVADVSASKIVEAETPISSSDAIAESDGSVSGVGATADEISSAALPTAKETTVKETTELRGCADSDAACATAYMDQTSAMADTNTIADSVPTASISDDNTAVATEADERALTNADLSDANAESDFDSSGTRAIPQDAMHGQQEAEVDVSKANQGLTGGSTISESVEDSLTTQEETDVIDNPKASEQELYDEVQDQVSEGGGAEDSPIKDGADSPASTEVLNGETASINHGSETTEDDYTKVSDGSIESHEVNNLSDTDRLIPPQWEVGVLGGLGAIIVALLAVIVLRPAASPGSGTPETSTEVMKAFLDSEKGQVLKEDLLKPTKDALEASRSSSRALSARLASANEEKAASEAALEEARSALEELQNETKLASEADATAVAEAATKKLQVELQALQAVQAKGTSALEAQAVALQAEVQTARESHSNISDAMAQVKAVDSADQSEAVLGALQAMNSAQAAVKFMRERLTALETEKEVQAASAAAKEKSLVASALETETQAAAAYDARDIADSKARAAEAMVKEAEDSAAQLEAALVEERDTRKKEKMEAESKASQITLELEAARAQMKTTQAKLKEAEETAASSQRRLAEVQTAANAAEAAYEQRIEDATKAAVIKAAKSLEAANTAVHSNLNLVQEQVSELTAEKKRLVQSHEAELVALEKTLEKRWLAAAREEVGGLKKEKAALQEKTVALEESVKEYKAQAEATSQKLEATEEAALSVQERLDEALSKQTTSESAQALELANAQEDARKSHEEVVSAQASIDEMRESMASTTEEHEAAVAKVHNELLEAQSELEAAKSAKSSADEQVKTMEQQLLSLTAENATGSSATELQAKLASAQAELETIAAAKKELEDSHEASVMALQKGKQDAMEELNSCMDRVRELEVEKEAKQSTITSLETKILSMQLAPPPSESSGSDKLTLDLQTAKEETAAVKELLREREEEAEQATKAQDQLHESAIISLQKSMTVVMDELNNTTARADALESDLSEAKVALDVKQQELDALKEQLHRLEDQSSDPEKVQHLESRVEALTAMLSMKSVGEGGGLLSEAEAIMATDSASQASTAAHSAAAKATEVASGFWGSMTSSIGSLVATTGLQDDEGDNEDVDDDTPNDSENGEPNEGDSRTPTKDLSAFLEENPGGDDARKMDGEEGGVSLDLNSFLEGDDGSGDDGDDGDDYGF